MTRRLAHSDCSEDNNRLRVGQSGIGLSLSQYFGADSKKVPGRQIRIRLDSGKQLSQISQINQRQSATEEEVEQVEAFPATERKSTLNYQPKLFRITSNKKLKLKQKKYNPWQMYITNAVFPASSSKLAKPKIKPRSKPKNSLTVQRFFGTSRLQLAKGSQFHSKTKLKQTKPKINPYLKSFKLQYRERNQAHRIKNRI